MQIVVEIKLIRMLFAVCVYIAPLFLIAVFKLIAIEDDRFMEIANLRVGKHKNINLNYSAADVAWNHHDGKVVILCVLQESP